MTRTCPYCQQTYDARRKDSVSCPAKACQVRHRAAWQTEWYRGKRADLLPSTEAPARTARVVAATPPPARRVTTHAFYTAPASLYLATRPSEITSRDMPRAIDRLAAERTADSHFGR